MKNVLIGFAMIGLVLAESVYAKGGGQKAKLSCTYNFTLQSIMEITKQGCDPSGAVAITPIRINGSENRYMLCCSPTQPLPAAPPAPVLKSSSNDDLVTCKTKLRSAEEALVQNSSTVNVSKNKVLIDEIRTYLETGSSSEASAAE